MNNGEMNDAINNQVERKKSALNFFLYMMERRRK